jgi:hypothetical protein
MSAAANFVRQSEDGEKVWIAETEMLMWAKKTREEKQATASEILALGKWAGCLGYVSRFVDAQLSADPGVASPAMASAAAAAAAVVSQGRVYVAAMNMRGARAPAPAGTLVVNVTSAQATANKNRRDFSPMTHVEGGYNGFWNFESYWQSGKVFAGIPHATSKAWWLACMVPKRRYPNSKGKTVLHAVFDHIDDPLNYVDSRKRVYVPEYYGLIKDREMTRHWMQVVAGGTDVVVYDFDGPRDEDGGVACMEVTVDMLRAKIEDTATPFGHGYVVAATIAGITPDQYV